MPHTIDLLQKALEMRKASQWCERFNITKGTIFQAKKRGSLSPTLAGAFAMEIGADPIFWTTVAAAEAEPPGPLRDRLERSLESQKTAHYGHPNDNDFQLISPLIQWAFCCQTATLKPVHQRPRYAVGISNRAGRDTERSEVRDFQALSMGQDGLTPPLHTARASGPNTGCSALNDERAFQLGHCAEDLNNEDAHGRACVHRLRQASERCAPLCEPVEDFQEVRQ